MFLELIERRNPALIRAAVSLHQSGKIPANTYVVDLDTVEANARAIVAAAEQAGVKLYFMSKHFNRNPVISAAIAKAGFLGAVAVDVQCAKSQWQFGNPVKHVGHLVQIPKHEIPHVLSMHPEVWTIYSVDNARLLSEAAVKASMVQDILLRVRSKEDIIYPNEEGGIWESDLEQAAKTIRMMPGVRIVGTVTFPGTLVSETLGGQATVNAKTAVRAAKQLESLGFDIHQINLPGASSAAMLPIVKAAGGTHAEPGHGILGTTPWHLIEDLPERPAMVYVNEISHTFEDKSYCFGGGFYACDTPANRGDDLPYRLTRKWDPHAFVGSDPVNIFSKKRKAEVSSFFGRTLNATDYYGALYTPEHDVHTGETAVFGFRAQAFTMRANLAVLRDIESNPRVVGVFDRANQLLDESWYPIANSNEMIRMLIKREIG